MATAVAPQYVRKRGFEDFYLAGSLELKGGALLGGDLDMAGFSILNAGSGGPVITTFTGLDDTPSSYVGQAGLFLRVDGGETGVAFVAGSGAVNSVFGRSGTVTAVSSDYQASQIDNDSAVAGVSVADALNTLAGLVVPAAPVDSVHGRIGNVVGELSDYGSDEIDNDSGVAGATVSAALDTLAATSVGFPLRAPDGFSSTPPYSFENSTNSGMYWEGGFLSLGEGGAKIFDSNGARLNVVIPMELSMRTLTARLEALNAVVATGFENQTATAHVHVYEGGTNVTRTLNVAAVNPGAYVQYVNNGTANLTIGVQGGDAIIDSGLVVAALVLPPGNSARLTATATNKWTVMSKTVSAVAVPGAELPAGCMVSFAGTVANVPAGFLPCDGMEYDQLTYPFLFGACGTLWNTGGETAGFFRVPDTRSRSPAGINSGDLPNGLNGGLTSRDEGDTAGAESHDHAVDNHTHTFGTSAGGAHTHVPQGATGVAGFTAPLVNMSLGNDGTHYRHTHPSTQSATHTHSGSTAGAVGGTGNGSSLSPTLFLNFIIKT